jgi:ribosomal protein S18 acetylase RimI-like enzyme
MAEFYAESSYALDRSWAAKSFGLLFDDARRGGAWIARSGGANAGYVVLTLRHSMEFGAPDGFIDDLFVRPEFRRRGVASSLLSALFEQCRQDGVAALHVEVGEDNAAAGALYREFGLAANGRRLLTAEIG